MIFIDSNKFGYFRIGKDEFKSDIKIVNDKVKIWNYVKHHQVMPEDVKELAEASPEIIIFGTGHTGLCKIQPETLKYLDDKNIKYLIKDTAQACSDFNRLASSKRKVFAILHATC